MYSKILFPLSKFFFFTFFSVFWFLTPYFSRLSFKLSFYPGQFSQDFLKYFKWEADSTFIRSYLFTQFRYLQSFRSFSSLCIPVSVVKPRLSDCQASFFLVFFRNPLDGDFELENFVFCWFKYFYFDFYLEKWHLY